MADFDDILHKGFEEYGRYVNPLISQRATLAEEPVKLVATEDGVCVDAEGRPVEDFHGTQTFGHRPEEISDAIRAYIDTDIPNWFPSRVNPFTGRLAKKLTELTDGVYDNVFFACTGSGANEAALKLARALTGRRRILSLEGAYHGCTYGSCSMMQAGVFKDRFGPFLPGAESLPFGDVDALNAAMDDDVVVVVAEPVQIEGGVRVLPDDYVDALCELTEEHGALLVADEVQTGLGRTGRAFLRSSLWPRRPDAIVMAKHLGGGVMPLSVMMTKRETFMEAYGDDFASGESHNNTMGNNALSAVVGLAALEMVTDDMLAGVAERGRHFRAALEEKIAGHSLVEEIRGEGLIVGIRLAESDHPWLSFEHLGFGKLGGHSVMAPLLCHRLFKRGYYCFTCGHDWRIVRILPRFEIPTAKIDDFVDACAEELEFIEELT